MMVTKKLSKKLVKDHKDHIQDLLAKCTSRAPVTDQEIEEILCLLNKIMDLEKESEIVSPPERTAEKMTAFVDWIRDQGIDVSKVEVGCLDGGDEYGLFAKKDIVEDELLLTIPQKVMLTARPVGGVASSDIGFLKDDPLVQEMPNLELVMILLEELSRGKQSFWYSYISILPKSYSTPLYMSPSDLLQLKPSPVFQESCKLIRNIARQYAYFWSLLQNHRNPSELPSFRRNITFDLYRWAVSTVMTRQNIIPVVSKKVSEEDGQPRSQPENEVSKKKLHALIPLWDLCNHEDGKFSTDFSQELKSIECFAMKSLARGSEIGIFYGNRPNEEFFIHNGFVPEMNPFDCLFITLGISKNDVLAGERTLLCHQLKLPVSGRFKLFRRLEGATKYTFHDPSLLGFLRVFHMTKEQLQEWSQRGDDAFLVVASTHGTLEGIDDKVVTFLSIRAGLLLKSYPSPQQLESRNLSIQRLLKSEQAILQSYIVH